MMIIGVDYRTTRKGESDPLVSVWLRLQPMPHSQSKIKGRVAEDPRAQKTMDRPTGYDNQRSCTKGSGRSWPWSKPAQKNTACSRPKMNCSTSMSFTSARTQQQAVCRTQSDGKHAVSVGLSLGLNEDTLVSKSNRRPLTLRMFGWELDPTTRLSRDTCPP